MKSGRVEYAPDYKSKEPTFTAFDGTVGSFREVFERNDAEIKRRLAEMSDGTASERARLEREVIEAAKKWWIERDRITSTTYFPNERSELSNRNDRELGVSIKALTEFESKQGDR